MKTFKYKDLKMLLKHGLRSFKSWCIRLITKMPPTYLLSCLLDCVLACLNIFMIVITSFSLYSLTSLLYCLLPHLLPYLLTSLGNHLSFYRGLSCGCMEGVLKLSGGCLKGTYGMSETGQADQQIKS